jgi:hypothetical protein
VAGLFYRNRCFERKKPGTFSIGVAAQDIQIAEMVARTLAARDQKGKE